MGDVLITVRDNFGGIAVVPRNTVQIVLGTSSAGTVGQPVVASGVGGPKVISDACGFGPGPEAAALTCLAGGTVVFYKCFSANAGTNSSVTATAGNTSTSVVTISGAPVDDGNFKLKVVTGCTIGVAGGQIQVSGDAGRTYGPVINLGTGNSYAISNFGTTINFGAGTLVTGDTFTWSSFAPSTDPSNASGGVSQTLTTLAASQYALQGWGSLHIVGGKDGTQTFKGWSYSNAHLIQGYLDTIATNSQIFSGAILSSRDVSPAAKWGGTAETESAWQTSLTTDYTGTSDPRIMVGAGYYNMPSAYPNASFGSWKPRRSLSWAAAARQVKIDLKTLNSRVSDGVLAPISVDSANDPLDGFIYHDERNSPALSAAKFMAARTRGSFNGFFIDEPFMMSGFGSDFDLWPKRVVMDAACFILHNVGQQLLNIDTRLNPVTFTIFENDARAAEIALKGALDTGLTSTGQISSCTVAVDRTNNVQTTKVFNVTASIVARGYILNINITIGYGATALAA